MELVERLINDPNSTLNENDREYLEGLPEDTLKRLAVGLQSQPAEDNVNTRESELRTALKDVQTDILTSIDEEQIIRDELEKTGVEVPSILDKIIPVTNQSSELTEVDINTFITNSSSVTAKVLQEALVEREDARNKSIEAILANCPEFTKQELRAKTTPELKKLAKFIVERSKPVHVENQVFDWVGTGLADQTIGQSTAMAYGPPLELPTTF